MFIALFIYPSIRPQNIKYTLFQNWIKFISLFDLEFQEPSVMAKLQNEVIFFYVSWILLIN